MVQERTHTTKTPRLEREEISVDHVSASSESS
jgi:hypothetical protein